MTWEGYKPLDEMKQEQAADLRRRGYTQIDENLWHHPQHGPAIATDRPGPRNWEYRREGLPTEGPLEMFTSLIVEYPH